MVEDVVKVDLFGVDEVLVTKDISDVFIGELEAISCAGALMGYQMEFLKNERMKQNQIMQVGFYKGEDFSFELLFMYNGNKYLAIENIKLLINTDMFDISEILTKCDELGLEWDGFYEVSAKTQEDVPKMFSLIKKFL